MTAPGRFNQSDVIKLLKAAKAAGYESASLVVELDGRLVLSVGPADEDRSPWMGQELE